MVFHYKANRIFRAVLVAFNIGSLIRSGDNQAVITSGPRHRLLDHTFCECNLRSDVIQSMRNMLLLLKCKRNANRLWRMQNFR